MNQASGRSSRSNADLVQMLSGLSASQDLAVVQRTRRAVYHAALEMRQRRARRRRNLGFALLAFISFFALLTPALWSAVDDVLAGEQPFDDMHGMVMSLVLLFFSTVLAALIAGWRHQHSRR